MMENGSLPSDNEKSLSVATLTPTTSIEGINGHSSSSIQYALSSAHIYTSDVTLPTSHGTYAEISSNQRYIRFPDLISQDGNIKFSFKAFDTKNGTEIVWQKIILSDLSDTEQRKILASANYLRAVRHQHILVYFDIWITDKPQTLNLITSYLDTLKQFVNKIGSLRWRIIKKWCKQILQALAYLHNSTPQIIHRNLTWRNIFVNPGVGDLYIGGMWLAAIIVDTPDVPISVSDALTSQYIGSPQYRAPEMANSTKLTTKMDIYSFGMCVLAMVTGEDPYNECESNSEQIYQLASRGVPPLGLKRIENPQCVDFVESCLKLNPEERLSVEQLFNHPFLQQNEENDDKVVSLGPASTRNIEELTKNLDEAKPVELIADPNPSQDGNNVSATPPSVDTQSLPPSHSVHISNHVSSETSERISNECPINHPPSSVSVPPTLPTLGERVSPNSSSVQVRVSTVPQGGVVTVELRLGEGDTANGIIQDVEFLFNIEQDNYEVVAAEMIQELNLTLPPDQLALLIQQHVASVLNSLETQPLSSPQQREVALPEKSLPPPSDATLKLEQSPSSPSSSVDALHHPLSHEVRQEPEPQQFGEFSPSQENPDFSNLDLYSHSDDSPNYSVVQVDSGSGQEEIQTTSKLSDKVEDLAPLDSNRSDDQSAIPRPDSDATPEELADFAELLREIEKIDKDCRAARRVFEQRIQKHKIIQDSCEEDLIKIESDYTAQCQQYDKSELKATQKKDDNIAVAKAEFDQKLQSWRESHHSRHLLTSPFDALAEHPSTAIVSVSGIATYSPGSTIPGIVPERTSTPSLGSSGASFSKPKS